MGYSEGVREQAAWLGAPSEEAGNFFFRFAVGLLESDV